MTASSHRSTRTLASLAVAGVVGVGAWCASAGAQGQPPPAPPRPPTPAQEDSNPQVLMNYLLLAVLFALIGGATAMPAKRGHQD